MSRAEPTNTGGAEAVAVAWLWEAKHGKPDQLSFSPPSDSPTMRRRWQGRPLGFATPVGDAAVTWDQPVNLGYQTDEPTLREMVAHYYRSHSMPDPLTWTDRYIAALQPQPSQQAGTEGVDEVAEALWAARCDRPWPGEAEDLDPESDDGTLLSIVRDDAKIAVRILAALKPEPQP